MKQHLGIQRRIWTDSKANTGRQRVKIGKVTQRKGTQRSIYLPGSGTCCKVGATQGPIGVGKQPKRRLRTWRRDSRPELFTLRGRLQSTRKGGVLWAESTEIAGYSQGDSVSPAWHYSQTSFQSQYRQETKTPNKSGGEEFPGAGSEDESQNSYKELTA